MNLQEPTIAEAGLPANGDEWLTFMLDGEEYGVEILSVEGIHGWNRATPIPNTPEHILGVINLRGAIVPIIDLRRQFGLEEIAFGPTTVVIILRVGDEATVRTVGIVVDAVSEVYPLSQDEIRPPPDFGTNVSADYLQGLATVDEKMLILLDVNHLISDALLGEIVEKAAANNVQ